MVITNKWLLMENEIKIIRISKQVIKSKVIDRRKESPIKEEKILKWIPQWNRTFDEWILKVTYIKAT